jgi:porphyrinogen peroxidase
LAPWKGTDHEILILLREVFKIHPLAVEDVKEFHQRPKIEDYDNFVSIVAYGARELGEPMTEVHCFYAERFLVSVHRDDVPAVTEACHTLGRLHTDRRLAPSCWPSPSCSSCSGGAAGWARGAEGLTGVPLGRPRQGWRERPRLTFPLGSLVPTGKGRSVTEWSQVPAVARPLPEPEPQPVLAPLTTAAIFMVLTIEPGGEVAVRDLLADWAGLQRSVGFRVPEAPLACVAGIGSHAWDRLFSGPRPAELHPFRALTGSVHRAVSTPGDLLFHVRHERMDVCFEFVSQAMIRLAGAATAVDEVHGFRYFDERDLLGFVDGTENPVGRAAGVAALTGDADPGFGGGSYVIVQKYLHDLDAWNALTVEEQEQAIGRTKLSDIEMPDDVKPANSHVALNTIEGPDGTERQILRANMPFGEVGRGEFGTYYIAYAATPSVTEQMLVNMFIGDPPGNYDRILDFSTAVTGSLYFAPSADFLDDLPDPPGAHSDSGEAGALASPESGSLGIGSLKRST